MADTGIGDGKARRFNLRGKGCRQTVTHHFRIVNAAPLVTAARHVASLAGLACGRLRACLPFDESIFQRFAVDGHGQWELMASATERRFFEISGSCHTAVWHFIIRRSR